MLSEKLLQRARSVQRDLDKIRQENHFAAAVANSVMRGYDKDDPDVAR